MKILTEHGEQAMGKLWAKQELEELCSWKQVLRMARQARRVRLDQQLSAETRTPDLKQGEAMCSLCMEGSCTGGWTNESGNVVCCQCTARRQEKDSMCEECWATRVEKQRFNRVAIDAHSKPK